MKRKKKAQSPPAACQQLAFPETDPLVVTDETVYVDLSCFLPGHTTPSMSGSERYRIHFTRRQVEEGIYRFSAELPGFARQHPYTPHDRTHVTRELEMAFIAGRLPAARLRLERLLAEQLLPSAISVYGPHKVLPTLIEPLLAELTHRLGLVLGRWLPPTDDILLAAILHNGLDAIHSRPPRPA